MATLPVRTSLGGADDFSRVYAEHRAPVYAIARRILRNSADAEEVTQDVFLTLWSRPERFQSERGPLRTYLSLLARSRALDAWRTRQAAARSLDRLALSTLTAVRVEEDCHAKAERAELGRGVRAAMRELPPEQREAVGLSYWAGLSTGEIARRRGIPDGTARSRLRLARAKLCDRLEVDPVADPSVRDVPVEPQTARPQRRSAGATRRAA